MGVIEDDETCVVHEKPAVAFFCENPCTPSRHHSLRPTPDPGMSESVARLRFPAAAIEKLARAASGGGGGGDNDFFFESPAVLPPPFDFADEGIALSSQPDPMSFVLRPTLPPPPPPPSSASRHRDDDDNEEEEESESDSDDAQARRERRERREAQPSWKLAWYNAGAIDACLARQLARMPARLATSFFDVHREAATALIHAATLAAAARARAAVDSPFMTKVVDIQLKARGQAILDERKRAGKGTSAATSGGGKTDMAARLRDIAAGTVPHFADLNWRAWPAMEEGRRIQAAFQLCAFLTPSIVPVTASTHQVGRPLQPLVMMSTVFNLLPRNAHMADPIGLFTLLPSDQLPTFPTLRDFITRKPLSPTSGGGSGSGDASNGEAPSLPATRVFGVARGCMATADGNNVEFYQIIIDLSRPVALIAPGTTAAPPPLAMRRSVEAPPPPPPAAAAAVVPSLDTVVDNTKAAAASPPPTTTTTTTKPKKKKKKKAEEEATPTPAPILSSLATATAAAALTAAAAAAAPATAVVPLEGKPKHKKKKKKSTMTPTAEEAPVPAVTGGLKRVAPTSVPEDAGLPPPEKKARTDMPPTTTPSGPPWATSAAPAPRAAAPPRGVRPVLCWLSRHVPLTRSHVISGPGPTAGDGAVVPLALHWSAALQATWQDVREIYRTGTSTIAYMNRTRRSEASDIQTRLITHIRNAIGHYWGNPSPDKKANAFLSQAMRYAFAGFDDAGEVRRVSLAFMAAVAWLALFLVDEEGAALLPDIPASLLQSDEIPRAAPLQAAAAAVAPKPLAAAGRGEEDDDEDIFAMASREPAPPPPPPTLAPLTPTRPVGIACPFGDSSGEDADDLDNGRLRLAVLMQMIPFHRDTLRAFLSDFKARRAGLLFGTDWRVPRILLRHSTSTTTAVPITGQQNEHTKAVLNALRTDFFGGFCAALGTKPDDMPSRLEFILALVAVFHACTDGPAEPAPTIPLTDWSSF